MEKSRPYVILSAAMTLDGKIGKNFTKIKLSSVRITTLASTAPKNKNWTLRQKI